MFLIEQTHFLTIPSKIRPVFLFILLLLLLLVIIIIILLGQNNEIIETSSKLKWPRRGVWIEGYIVTSIISSDLYASFYGYFSDLADTFGEVSQNE